MKLSILIERECLFSVIARYKLIYILSRRIWPILPAWVYDLALTVRSGSFDIAFSAGELFSRWILPKRLSSELLNLIELFFDPWTCAAGRLCNWHFLVRCASRKAKFPLHCIITRLLFGRLLSILTCVALFLVSKGEGKAIFVLAIKRWWLKRLEICSLHTVFSEFDLALSQRFSSFVPLRHALLHWFGTRWQLCLLLMPLVKKSPV